MTRRPARWPRSSTRRWPRTRPGNRSTSKRKQAAGALQLQGKAFSPTVIGIANYNLNRGSSARANWLVGVSVSVPLVERIDRAKMIAAARLEQQRVEVAAEQAGRDIPTLAESQWRAMEDARQRYLAMGSAIELAYETRRLAQVAFQNGQATSTEVADASLNFTKTALERAQAAYEYVLALARLLGTAGDPDRLYALSKNATYIVDLTERTKHHGHMLPPNAPLALAAAAVVIVALLGWGCTWLSSPTRDPVQGQIEAQEMNVASKVPGRVGRVHVQLGQTVARGDLLFELDSPEVRAKVAQAEAARDAARATSQKAAGRRAAAGNRRRARQLGARRGRRQAGQPDQRSASGRCISEGVVARQKRDDAEAQARAGHRTGHRRRAPSMSWRARAPATRTSRPPPAQVRQVAGVVAETDAALDETRITAPGPRGR